MAYRRASTRRAPARGRARSGYRSGRAVSRRRSAGVRSGSPQRIRIELVHSAAGSVSRPAELIGMKPAEPPATSRF